MPAMQAFPATLTFMGSDFSRVIRVMARRFLRVVEARA
jgi:hypothetical protein